MNGECSVSCAAQDEGVLRDVLNELEKERIRRAELENQIIEMNKSDETENTSADASKAPPGIDDILCSMHRINSMVAKYNSTIDELTQAQHYSQNLSPLLIALFKELFDFTVGICEHTRKTEKYESTQEKHVEEAVSQVMSCYKQHVSKGLSLEKNTAKFLCPILNVTVTDFIVKLEQMADDKGHQSGKRMAGNAKADRNTENEMRLKILSLRTEKDGLLDVIDALTSDNNAISLASKNSPGTLPIHTVRCLEVMPWDVQQYASVFEEVHEWQTYDQLKQAWTSKLKAFPSRLADLPTQDHEHISDQLSETDSYQLSPTKGKNRLRRVVESFSLSGSLLTDVTCSNTLDLRRGYPLPTRGEWEWIGGWTIEDEPELNDDEGWSYAEQLEDHMSDARLQCYNTEKSSTDGTHTRCFRRRTSKRQRVLISYPGISQRTKQMLSMNAQNAKLMHGISKLNDKVFSIQHQLVQKEAEIDISTELSSQLSTAECKIEERDKKIREMEPDSKRKTSNFFTKPRPSSKVKLLGGKGFSKKTVSSLLGDTAKIKRSTEKSETNDTPPSLKPIVGFFESIINNREYYENMVNNATSHTPKPVVINVENSDEDTLAVNSDSADESSLELDEDVNTSSGKNKNWLVESVRSNVLQLTKG